MQKFSRNFAFAHFKFCISLTNLAFCMQPFCSPKKFCICTLKFCVSPQQTLFAC